ncbi:MAG: hypothetical protein ABIH87_04335 [bacterium]
MLNIISKSYLSNEISGPKKVVDNLIKGLEKIKYPYVVNERLDACRRLWIHDDIYALKKIGDLNEKIKTIVGPNLYILPRNIPTNIDLSKAVYLCPSEWTKHFWVENGFDRCPLEVWATGIDTEVFKSKNQEKKFVLVYFKQRLSGELQQLEDVLKKKQIDYKLIRYGSYQEKTFQSLLAQAKYAIWLGRQESQGIALQETMSMDVPLLVWDVKNLGHWQPRKREVNIFNEKENSFALATTIPYFNENCGLAFKDVANLDDNIDKMEQAWMEYTPRDYILEHLSLEKKAKDLLELYEKHYGLSVKDGYNEDRLSKGKWRNEKFYYKLYFGCCEILKKIIKSYKKLINKIELY